MPAGLSTMRRSTPAWFCRRYEREREDRPSPSTCCLLAVSHCDNASILLAPAIRALDSRQEFLEVGLGDIARRKTQCTSQAGSAAPTPACCCALPTQWWRHPGLGDKSCSQI